MQQIQPTIEIGQITRVKKDGSVVIPLNYLRSLGTRSNMFMKIVMIGKSLILAPLESAREKAA